MLMRDHDIHKRNEDNIEHVIEQEVEYIKFQHGLKDQLRLDKEEQERKKDRIIQEEKLSANTRLQDLKDKFQVIASLVPTLQKE